MLLLFYEKYSIENGLPSPKHVIIIIIIILQYYIHVMLAAILFS